MPRLRGLRPVGRRSHPSLSAAHAAAGALRCGELGSRTVSGVRTRTECPAEIHRAVTADLTAFRLDRTGLEARAEAEGRSRARHAGREPVATHALGSPAHTTERDRSRRRQSPDRAGNPTTRSPSTA